MAVTGETYQTARARILAGIEEATCPVVQRVDLIPVRCWGAAVALATFEIAGRLAIVVTAATPSGPFPRSPMFGFSPSRLVQ